MDAIVIRDLTKRFKKYGVRRDVRTFKSELIRVLLRRPPPPTAAPQFVRALEGIDLALPQGKTLGLVGRNGSGKSTLLKLITGIYKPTSGKIEVHGRISALLELGAGFHPDFTGRENILINGIMLGMSRAQARARIDEIIAFSELGDFIDAPVRTYSSGMFMRLAFSVATHVDPDILIVDEILAVGDEHFSRKSLAKMTEFKKSGKTIVLVTHDLGTLQSWCDLAAWIDQGRIRKFGDPAEVVHAYRHAVAEEEARAVPAQSAPISLAAAAQAALPELTVPVAISEVALLDRAGAPVGLLTPDDALSVKTVYRSQPAVTDVEFAVELRHSSGQLVFATTTRAAGVTLPSPLPREGELKVTLDPLSLLDGEYTVDVLARSTLGTPFDDRRGARFRVSSPVREGGMVRIPHRWELTPGVRGLTGS